MTINHFSGLHDDVYYSRRHSRRRGCAFSRVCLTGKRLELSTPNLVNLYSIAVARHALAQRSKGHTVTKTVAVSWLLVTMAGIV